MKRTIRPLRPEDAPRLAALLDWAWFAPRSEAGWRWLSQAPRSEAAGELATGYVAEDEDGRIGAMYGQFAQDYACAGERFVGATGHTLVVHPDMKGVAARMIRQYAETPGVFGVYHFNANARSAPLYPRFGFDPCPADHGDTKLVWAIDPLTILAERAARLRQGEARPDRERFIRERVFTRELGRLGRHVEQVFTDRIDARFDAFWEALAAEGRLVARRDAAALRWRMADPDRTLDPFLLAWIEDGAVVGYLLAQVAKLSQIEAPNLEVIDLIALGPYAERAERGLMQALLRNASDLGVARVRLSVVNTEMARRLDGLDGVTRSRHHVHGHARLTDQGRAMASDWRLTPYDADYGFCLRSPPRPGGLKDSRAA